jgi:uncharacterized protein YjbI with pentapeptide repeats
MGKLRKILMNSSRRMGSLAIDDKLSGADLDRELLQGVRLAEWQIKDLFLELIGEDYIGANMSDANDLKAELRQKVKEL